MIAAAFLRPLWWMALGSLRLLIGLAIAALTLTPVTNAAQAASATPSMNTASRWVVGLPVSPTDAGLRTHPTEAGERVEAGCAVDQQRVTAGPASESLALPVGRSDRSTGAPWVTDIRGPGGAAYGWALGQRAPPGC